jgi:UrcA family protein
MFPHLSHRRACGRFLLALCLAGTAFAAPGAQAEPTVRSERVRTGDLDLTTDRDRAKLDRRIRSAARHVCSSFRHEKMLQRTDMSCVKKAIAKSAKAKSKVVEHAMTSQRGGATTNIAVFGLIVRSPFAPDVAPHRAQFDASRAQ